MRRASAVVFFVLALVSCAASRKEGRPSAAPADVPSPAPATGGQPGQYPPAQGYPQQQPMPGQPGQQPAPSASTGDSATTPSTTQNGGSSSYATPPNRAVAMGQAANEIESSQRELDVAGGDCRNACRALGSMDRAAGRLCSLAQSPDETRKCSDTKTRVYSARDKVRNTCGTCPDTSVDKNAPVPSR